MVLLFTEVYTLSKRIPFFFFFFFFKKNWINKTIETEDIVVLHYDIS